MTLMKGDRIFAIAQVCHEANRAYCAAIGDDSQSPWENAPEWQMDSAVSGVQKIADGEITAPEQSHEGWSAHKLAEGWKYGEVKDPEAKTHPCLVPFGELPLEQQLKDRLFFSIAKTLLSQAAADPAELKGAVRNLQKWVRGGHGGYPFVIGAVPIVLAALERERPELRYLTDDVLT